MSRRSVSAFMVGFMAVILTVISGVFLSTPARAAAPASIFRSSTPLVLSDSDTAKVELGIQFKARVAGKVTGIRFFKGPLNVGKHTGSLWSGANRIATAPFRGETSSNWQEVTFAEPVPIAAGKVYTASYLAPVGRYAVDNPYSFPKTMGDLTAIKGVYQYGGGYPEKVYRSSNYWVDVLFVATASSADPTPTSSQSSQTSTPPSTVVSTSPSPPASATSPPVTPPSTSTTSPGPVGTWPGPDNTGVPKQVILSAYAGPMTITVANTSIDAKTITGDLVVRAANVRVTNSRINGSIATDENSTGYSFVIEDSEVYVGERQGTGVGAVNFTATRVNVHGGNRSMNCWKTCLIQDSWVHGQFTDRTGVAHESGIRMGADGIVRHNTIACDAPDVPPDAGCSAALTGYGDFAAVANMTIDGNLLLASTGGFCAYGGSSAGKPFSSAAHDIRFTGNVFQRGGGGKCGYWGAITDFNPAMPGNVWARNTWDDGTVLNP